MTLVWCKSDANTVPAHSKVLLKDTITQERSSFCEELERTVKAMAYKGVVVSYNEKTKSADSFRLTSNCVGNETEIELVFTSLNEGVLIFWLKTGKKVIDVRKRQNR